MSCLGFIQMNILTLAALTFGLLVCGQQPSYHIQQNRNNRIEKRIDTHFVKSHFNSPESSGNNGAVIFVDPDSGSESPVTYDRDSSRELKTSHKKVPLNFMKTLSNNPSLDFIFQKYVKNVAVMVDGGLVGKKFLVKKENGTVGTPLFGRNQEKIFITSDSTHETSSPDGHMRVAVLSERTATKPHKVTQSAACQPESRTVELSVKFDPHIIYIPRCVRLERCGGCCATDILSCEAREKIPVEVLVNKFAYIGDEKTDEMKFLEQESVMMEQHTKCECKCRVKAENCSFKHTYVEDECQCVCQNREEHEKCALQPHKIWDANTCECSCREIKDCNSGYVFSLRNCLCELLPSTLDSSGRRGRKRRTHHTRKTE